HVELVSLRVEHGDAVLVILGAGSNERGARCGQPFDHLIDTRPPVRGRRPWRAARVHVQVQTVLHGLGLRHTLKVDARPVAIRVGDRAGIIPAFFRDAVLHQPGLPCGGRLGRALQLIAERIGPEPRYYRRISAIEDDLDRDSHAIEPSGRRIEGPDYTGRPLSGRT